MPLDLLVTGLEMLVFAAVMVFTLGLFVIVVGGAFVGLPLLASLVTPSGE
jgi:hypothetical protein